jgi:hypothetical protein
MAFSHYFLVYRYVNNTGFGASNGLNCIPKVCDCHWQCYGSGRFLTGSGSGFRNRRNPDPDLDLNKFSENSGNFFGRNKVCSKSVFMNQKVKQQRFLMYLPVWLLPHTKIVDVGSFIKAKIRIRSQTSRSGSDRIRICNTGHWSTIDH